LKIQKTLLGEENAITVPIAGSNQGLAIAIAGWCVRVECGPGPPVRFRFHGNEGQLSVGVAVFVLGAHLGMFHAPAMTSSRPP
jgi:hypothetical protein